MSFKIVLATGNAHKLKEIRAILAPHDIEVYGLKDLAIDIGEVDENGTTYQQNALIKANAVAKYAKLPVISDDSGLEVKAMDNRPGLYSARFADQCGGHEKAIEEILKEVNGKDRSARFVCSIALVNYPGGPHLFTGITTGVIADHPEGQLGFGYDPIFICDDLKRNYALLSEEEKNAVSHRAKALKEFVEFLKKNKDAC